MPVMSGQNPTPEIIDDVLFGLLGIQTAAGSGRFSTSVSLNGSKPSILISTISAGAGARTTDVLVARQNLYTIKFADGTVLYNCIVTNVQVSQGGVNVTFSSGQTSATATFAGPPDPTQLNLWNIVQTTG